MTGRPILTDDSLAAMLRSRGSAPMPIGLARGIADAVATDAAAGTVTGSRRSRPGGRSWPLLLVAAALLVALGGSVLVLSRPASPEVPSTPGPSAAVVLPSPTTADVGSLPCRALDAIAEAALLGAGGIVDPEAIIGATLEPPRNGPILAMVGRDATTSMRLPIELWQIAPFPEGAPDETRILGGFGFERGAARGMVPSPNGAAVALAVDPYEGPVLTQPDCADVVLLTTSDGRSAGRIFGASLGERFTEPTWSADGSRLFAIRSNSRPCTEVTDSSTRTSYDCSTPLESSLVAWDVATDEVVDLGRPCEGCTPEGRLIASLDGRLAVSYAEGSGGHGLAILGEDGDWSLVPPAPGTTWSELTGWLDDGRLRIADPEGLPIAVDAATGTAEALGCCRGPLSPDGRLVATVVASDTPTGVGEEQPPDYVDVTTIATGEQTRILSPDSATARLLGSVTWSPDSYWLAMEMVDTGTGLHQLYVTPADGSAAPRLVPERDDGPLHAWTWLPARP